MVLATISITDLHNFINNDTTLRNCEVVSVTHSKNVNSPVLHEYLHLVVRPRNEDRWLRVIVERQTGQDQVVMGFWPWITPGRRPNPGDISREAPLPLIMRSLRFPKSYPIKLVADVLLKVHRQRPSYHLLAANCFWYADAVFTTLRGTARGIDLTNYNWVIFRGLALIPNIILLTTIRFAAHAFNNRLPENPFTISESMGAPWPYEATEDDATESSILTNIMKEKDLAHNLELDAMIDLNRQRKEDITAFANYFLDEAERDANILFFDEYLNKNKGDEKQGEVLDEENEPAFIQELSTEVDSILASNAPSKEDEYRYDQALRAFAGKILRELSEQKKSEDVPA